MSTYDLANEMERMREDNAQLERERDRLVAERDLAKNSLHNTTGTMEVWKRRCLAAEAERDRLIQALRTISTFTSETDEEGTPHYFVEGAAEVARAALAPPAEP